MDNSQAPSFEIPKSAENAPVYTGGQEFDPSISIEGTREILPPPVLQTMPLSGSGLSPATPATSSSPIQQPTVGSDDSHIIADDIDVIEKEWVDRAKKIVALTSNDPYIETKELGKLKATYLKKRFNKDLPMSADGVN